VKPIARTTEHVRAAECGMTRDQWVAARHAAANARSRGKRSPETTQTDLKDWGPVPGQLELFAE
jgi:hypothetical protein